MKSWSDVVIPTLSESRRIPSLFLSDTASSSKKKIARKNLYRMYVCGITPYDATHLGHAATYLTFDLINRYLRASGAEVNYVQNITDIDDPLLERANRDGVDWRELAHQQIELFRDDMVDLRVIPPSHYIGAVDAIPLVVDAISELSTLSTIYQVDSDQYFSVHADERFGSRSHLSEQEMVTIFSERGGDPNRSGKKNPLDCLVWISQRPNEPGWDSILGIGRPGWHIECTAIALKYLDPSDVEPTLIDIQGGGSDLIFPHHEMCAAQAHVLTGKELAASYVHTGMIGLDGEKMSKSKGNLVFVSRLVAAGTDPMAIRYALMANHYRSDRMWSAPLLQEAEANWEQIKKALVSDEVAPTEGVIDEIINALSDDLDTPKVLSLLVEWSSATLSGARGGSATEMREVLDALLGLKV
ncbi:MAG: cysteine--1-D-myo-inosityl 2-amino-2-deoxy-alpha-D-glucopyranoside ligase [Candidatus Planktophila sp.]|nr:cysteine--1-D-myo-inosityl 2-amino-2-deoxy-alpha-D-glucopyranoside ligase [Candidatus Planktophila sp.]